VGKTKKEAYKEEDIYGGTAWNHRKQTRENWFVFRFEQRAGKGGGNPKKNSMKENNPLWFLGA